MVRGSFDFDVISDPLPARTPPETEAGERHGADAPHRPGRADDLPAAQSKG